MLGISGAALGLVLAYWGTEALIAARPADIPRVDQIGLDSTVVLFTLGLAVFTSLAFGMVPALQVTSAHLTRALQEGGRGGVGRTTHRVRAALVVGEMALAVVLLTGSGLLIRSFLELTRVDPGFEAHGAMAVRLTFQGENYQKGDQIRNSVADLEERMRALPAVLAVASTTVLPLSGQGALLGFAVEGAPPPPPNVNQEIAVASVTPDYFRAIGAPLRRGRVFDVRDHPTAPKVALINEAGARKWFPGQDPVGKSVNIGTTLELVGIRHRRQKPGEPAGAAVRPVRTAHLALGPHGHPHRRRPARPRRRDSRAGADARSESAGRRVHDSRSGRRALGGTAAVLHVIAHPVCRSGARPRGDRRLWRDELYRGAARA